MGTSDRRLRFSGQTVVITGAANGIGRTIAVRFAAEGAHVVIADLRETPDELEPNRRSTTDLAEETAGSATFVATDVTVESDVDRVVSRAAGVSGRIDVVVSNAGAFGGSPILSTALADWERDLRVNLTSHFLVGRRVIRQMIGQPDVHGTRGRLIFVTSQLGVTAPKGRLSYAVAKAGLAHLTRQLAVDYADHGILVNAVLPGRIVTGRYPGERAYLNDGTEDEAIAYFLSRTPFPRLGTAQDVAGAVLFLASADCTFVSGHNLAVDGGWLAY